MAETILDSDEPDPVTFDNEAGRSVFFLTCDHAGRAIPRRLDGLGLPEHETRRHIAWDIGVRAVGRQLSLRRQVPEPNPAGPGTRDQSATIRGDPQMTDGRSQWHGADRPCRRSATAAQVPDAQDTATGYEGTAVW